MKFIGKAVTILSALTLAVFLSSCNGSGVIARIEFSGDGKTAGMRNIEFDLTELSNKTAELDEALGVLPTLINVSHNYDVEKLLSSFGMTDENAEKHRDPDYITYTNGSKTLVLYEAGFVSYTDTSLYGESCTLSKTQIEERAKAQAEKSGIDISDLYLKEAVIDENIATVSFSRRVNDTDTVGQTGMTVKFNGTEISSFSFTASVYSGELEIEPVGVSKALELLISEKASHNFGRQTGQAVSPIKTVKVTDVRLVYWDSAYTQTKMFQTHIQPVYYFTGTCIDAENNETPYIGYVRAISDDITANFRVDSVE